jgi:hypothetical protein
MNAIEALNMAFAAGVHLEIDNANILVLADAPPPSELMDALTRNKADIVGLLKPVEVVFHDKDWRTYFNDRVKHAQQQNCYNMVLAEFCAFEDCVEYWLVLNLPKPVSFPTCIHCEQPAIPKDNNLVHVVAGIAVGVVHSNCAANWIKARRWQGRRALMWLFEKTEAVAI